MLVRNVTDKTFTDAVVYLTGNMFLRCTFENCTFVFQGFPVGFDSCHFNGAHIWRIEFTVHDADQWDEFMTALANIITNNIPEAPP